MYRFLKLAGLAGCAAAVGLGTYLFTIQATGNFSEVVPGALYRSNQPTALQVADYAERYGIKTIVNLRGSSEDAAWYKNEVAAAQALGIKHIDFKMIATRELSVEEAHKLVTVLRDAPTPILIHCKSGADRTGLASVLYLNRIAGVDEDIAERQLSIRFGHFSIPFLSPTYAMDENWEMLEKVYGLSG
ncbi:protein tyrosine phosphatase [Rhizobium sp. Root73]|uniref:dual specificity protein phosphatase family protein n=1 Tax=unclassified Rhizobium TaxID=2613769 RepID=UPI000713FF86|nr:MULTISPECIES: dual specificity protein phosphatase family protein [unclassified Rhizobium]KQV30096.1 protein tyrosine phosphatase [Rhizobium sp. Root1204]KQY01203.1 protein tyrosine phosphatase [Rhizobium sp. Root1334]KRB96665.1 protein tyrosine phosphatase [Rhizobium sp. Root73]